MNVWSVQGINWLDCSPSDTLTFSHSIQDEQNTYPIICRKLFQFSENRGPSAATVYADEYTSKMYLTSLTWIHNWKKKKDYKLNPLLPHPCSLRFAIISIHSDFLVALSLALMWLKSMRKQSVNWQGSVFSFQEFESTSLGRSGQNRTVWVWPEEEKSLPLFVSFLVLVCLSSFEDCSYPSFTISAKSLLAA